MSNPRVKEFAHLGGQKVLEIHGADHFKGIGKKGGMVTGANREHMRKIALLGAARRRLPPEVLIEQLKSDNQYLRMRVSIWKERFQARKKEICRLQNIIKHIRRLTGQRPVPVPGSRYSKALRER